MERKTALMIKEQIMGTTTGHMANVPNSPILWSIFTTLIGDDYDPVHDNKKEKAFAALCREIADALEVETNEQD